MFIHDITILFDLNIQSYMYELEKNHYYKV